MLPNSLSDTKYHSENRLTKRPLNHKPDKIKEMLLIQSTISPPVQKTLLVPSQVGKHGCYLALHGRFGSPSASFHFPRRPIKRNSVQLQIFAREVESFSLLVPEKDDESSEKLLNGGDITTSKGQFLSLSAFSCGSIFWLTSGQVASASESVRVNMVYEVGELFELGIQLTYLLILLALLGAGSFFVIRQVLVRRELDLSAKELQEQVRSGDASATELFELGAVMLRRKFYPAATKYLLQAVQKWDGDDQDLAQVYNALGVSYVLDEKIDKGIAQFENAVKLQPGYVTAWNNLGDAYEKTKDLTSALRAFEEVLLFDPNNKIARPRRDALKDKVQMYKGVPVKSKKS